MQFKFHAVVFDMDNTIHDLYAARFAAAGAVMSFCKLEGDLPFFLMNPDTPALIEDCLREFRGFDDSEAIWLFKAVERNALQIFAGMRELLSELKRAGVKLAIISNAKAEDLALRVKELGLEGIFDVLVTPDMFGVKKPKPEVYLKTLELLDVLPSESVMIGDRSDRDVEPPRAAGISAVHAWYGSFDVRDKICAVSDSRELISVLRKQV
ncbi:MAG TPA: HAD-IA family hydrolase [Methanocorpusculum sp.]|nr:HAD-IA family hydrolase [Methanocorpusculum sp.]